MHYAVMQGNLSVVRMLDEYGADATIKDQMEISAIDYAITENKREIKLHFMGQQKYKNFDFSGLGIKSEQ